MGRADLFTEYTTIALLPVLTGDAGIGALARFWGLVYIANLIGGGLLALVVTSIGPAWIVHFVLDASLGVPVRIPVARAHR